MVFVIGEIGVNWDGDFELVKNMIKQAKDSGCNAVKFQAYKKELIEKHPENVRLIKSAISESNIKQIDSICKDVKIEWFCTPMYEEAVDFLDPYVKKFKIREYDSRELIENKRTKLFDKVFDTGKEIIISTNKSPKSCQLFKEPRIKWLYCVPKYPCELEFINFSNLKDFNGYSNHHPHFIAPLLAVILGAEIIEIHITSDKSKNFVDNNVSFDFKELKNMVELIHKVERIKR
jgi:sialic acid synthase SpsE